MAMYKYKWLDNTTYWIGVTENDKNYQEEELIQILSENEMCAGGPAVLPQKLCKIRSACTRFVVDKF